MTITRKLLPAPLKRTLWVAALMLAPLGVTCAWQATPTYRAATSPSLQYQQSAQQQQTRDQLQKSQLQQQLHRGVTDNARRPNANDARTQQQQDAAERAQRARDYANQQDLLDRERDASKLPRVVPKDLPSPSHSG
jgi:hypothetical protein